MWRKTPSYGDGDDCRAWRRNEEGGINMKQYVWRINIHQQRSIFSGGGEEILVKQSCHLVNNLCLFRMVNGVISNVISQRRGCHNGKYRNGVSEINNRNENRRKNEPGNNGERNNEMTYGEGEK
jgi:hypothetical protein